MGSSKDDGKLDQSGGVQQTESEQSAQVNVGSQNEVKDVWSQNPVPWVLGWCWYTLMTVFITAVILSAAGVIAYTAPVTLPILASVFAGVCFFKYAYDNFLGAKQSSHLWCALSDDAEKLAEPKVAGYLLKTVGFTVGFGLKLLHWINAPMLWGAYAGFASVMSSRGAPAWKKAVSFIGGIIAAAIVAPLNAVLSIFAVPAALFYGKHLLDQWYKDLPDEQQQWDRELWDTSKSIVLAQRIRKMDILILKKASYSDLLAATFRMPLVVLFKLAGSNALDRYVSPRSLVFLNSSAEIYRSIRSDFFGRMGLMNRVSFNANLTEKREFDPEPSPDDGIANDSNTGSEVMSFSDFQIGSDLIYKDDSEENQPTSASLAPEDDSEENQPASAPLAPKDSLSSHRERIGSGARKNDAGQGNHHQGVVIPMDGSQKILESQQSRSRNPSNDHTDSI